MILRKRIALAALAAAAILPAAQVGAADYDPPVYVEPAEEYAPVEIGSGWYLRGDVGYIFDHDFKDIRRSASPEFLAFEPFAPMLVDVFERKDTPLMGSVGIGYHFNDFLRGDLNLGILPGEKSSIGGLINGGCAGTQRTEITHYDADGAPIVPSAISSSRQAGDCTAELSADNTYWTGLANGYIDLGTYAGFTPYIGAGLGVVYSKTELHGSATCSASSTMESISGTETRTQTFLCDGQDEVTDAPVEYVGANYSDRNYAFMYAANAGFSYQMTKNASLDVGYQYMNSPDARFVRVTKNGPEFGEGIDYHTVKVGVRYDLW